MRILCSGTFTASIAVLLLSLGGFSARAGIIHDNGAAVANTGGYASDLDLGQREGDDFELGSAATLSGVQWWGFYLPSDTPGIDNFTIQLFDFVSGAPATTPFFSAVVGDAGRTDTGLTSFGETIYLYSAILPDVPLGAGQYLLSVVNDTTADTDDNWTWILSPSQGGEHWVRQNDTGSWGSSNRDFAFQLTGDFLQVPEPAALALFGVGLAGLGVLRRRRTVA